MSASWRITWLIQLPYSGKFSGVQINIRDLSSEELIFVDFNFVDLVGQRAHVRDMLSTT